MAGWADQVSFLADIDAEARQALQVLKPMHVPQRTTLFRPGDAAQSFVILLSGRIGVYLTGRNGRELLLYSVTPGETCVQTTLGVLGGAPYSGEAVAESDLVAVMVPPAVFERLMAHALLERADEEGRVALTHQELAAVIGTAREVVSRRLEALSSKGVVENERGQIRLVDRGELSRMARVGEG